MRIHYNVGPCKFYNGVLAWEHRIKHPEHHHMTIEFDQPGYFDLDWTKEPVLPIDQLLAVRARRLRQKYSNLRLWYSSGRDSQCILETFLKNNIPLDEILIIDWCLVERHTKDLEVIKSILTKTYQKYSTNLPTVRIFHANQDAYEQYYENYAIESSTGFLTNYNFSINSYPNILRRFPELQTEKFGEILGIDKPKIQLHNNVIYHTIYDKQISHAMSMADNIEWFYITPEFPELACKQVWMMLNYLTVAYPKFDSNFLIKFQGSTDYYNEFSLSVGRGTAESLLTAGGFNKSFGFDSKSYNSVITLAQNEQWKSFKYYTDYQQRVLESSRKNPEFWDKNSNAFHGVGINPIKIKDLVSS